MNDGYQGFAGWRMDNFIRESVTIEVDTSISGQRVTRVLNWLKTMHGLP